MGSCYEWWKRDSTPEPRMDANGILLDPPWLADVRRQLRDRITSARATAAAHPDLVARERCKARAHPDLVALEMLEKGGRQ